MQPHIKIHSSYSFVIPSVALVTQVSKHLAKAPTRFPFSQFLQLCFDLDVVRLFRCIAIICPTEAYHTTRLALAQTMPLSGHAARWGFTVFFSTTSLITWCSRFKSAYICFSLWFSASSSLSRFKAEASRPPNLAFHLLNFLWPKPYWRDKSGTGTPASASFRILMI